MRRFLPAGGTALAALVTFTAPVQAQVLSVTPRIGHFAQAGGARSALSGLNGPDATLSLGAAVDLDAPILPVGLRVALDYAPHGATAMAGAPGGGEGLLAASGDLVFQSLPIPLLRPYLLAGVGYLRGEPLDTGAARELRSARRYFHTGAGLTLNLGSLGLDVQVSDFIRDQGGFADFEHHVSGTVGVRLGLF